MYDSMYEISLLGLVSTTRNPEDQTHGHDDIECESRSQIRDERRTAFVEYLSAYRALYGRALLIKPGTDSDALDNSYMDRHSRAISYFVKLVPEDVETFNRAYYTLMITANTETREAADQCTQAFWDFAETAILGSAEEIQAAIKRTVQPRHDLRAAMRRELNVE
jgi:hypothetical protein